MQACEEVKLLNAAKNVLSYAGEYSKEYGTVLQLQANL